MPTPIELTLSTLLPTISFLPPELISLATSLLAQSRAKAASLRAEEEIGRTYACAHIACERLKNRLALEIGEPKPPVKPRVYVRLKSYLEGVLGKVETPRTPGRRNEKSNGATQVSTPVETPVSTRTTRTTPATGKRAREAEPEAETPDFLMPMIRHVCKNCGMPAAAPHVFVGTSTVVREINSRSAGRATGESSAKRSRRTPQSTAKAAPPPAQAAAVVTPKWPALTIALYLITTAKMLDVDTNDEKIEFMRQKAVGAIEQFCIDGGKSVPNVLLEKLETLDSSIGFYMLEAEDCGWLDMEWYQNIPAGDADIIGDELDQDEDELATASNAMPAKTPLRRKEKHAHRYANMDENDYVGAAGLLPGLATMFHPAIDWLSDDRRVGYNRWREGILREIAIVEQIA